MSNGTVDDDTDNDLGRGGLTETDREYLRKSESERREDFSRQARSAARSRIRKRARASLRDFRVLADHLDTEERDKIFSVEQGTQEQFDLETDLTSLMAFVYAGLGSEGAFRRVLKDGVRRGVADSYVHSDIPALTNVRFEVEPAPALDLEETAKHIKNSEFRKLTDSAARGFLLAAKASSNEFDDELIDAIMEDLKDMRERIDQKIDASAEDRWLPRR